MPENRPSSLASIEAEIDQALKSPAWAAAGDDNARRALLMEAVCNALAPDRLHPASALVTAYKLALRNQRIRQMFDGRNHRELAGRFRLTQRQLRRILHRHCPKK